MLCGLPVGDCLFAVSGVSGRSEPVAFEQVQTLKALLVICEIHRISDDNGCNTSSRFGLITGVREKKFHTCSEAQKQEKYDVIFQKNKSSQFCLF